MPSRLPSFWIAADMFHLSKVFYWNLVRTIQAHTFLGSPTPNGEIAFHIMAKEHFSLVRYAAEQWVSRPVSVLRFQVWRGGQTRLYYAARFGFRDLV